MDIEKGLVSKVLESKDIRTVIKHKVTPKFFYGEAKQVFSSFSTIMGSMQKLQL